MDEKTRALRDIFLRVADDATVTESQDRPRGSLASDASEDERLSAVVESLRARDAFWTTLPVPALVEVVRGVYAGASDAEIASVLEAPTSPEAVATARLDLHLVTDGDVTGPPDIDAVREAVEAGTSDEAIAERLDVEPSAVRRARRVLETQRARRSVGDRYREEFDRILADADLQGRLTGHVRETGLEDATEGMESNVSF